MFKFDVYFRNIEDIYVKIRYIEDIYVKIRNIEDIYVKIRNIEDTVDDRKYTQQKKLRKSQKTIEHRNTKANHYSIFIYLFRYISSVEKDASFSLLALIPLLWHRVKWTGGQSHFSQKRIYRVFPLLKQNTGISCKFSKLEMQFL